MYRNILLSILAVFAGIAAVKLAPTRQAPAPPIMPGPDDLLLATPVGEFSAHGISVAKAVELLSHKSGVPIHVAWKSLNEYRDKPCEIALHDVRLDDAIAVIFTHNRLDRHHWPPISMEVEADQKTIAVVLPFPSAASRMTTRVYDVGDLLTDENWGPSRGMIGVDLANDRAERLGLATSSLENWEFCGIQMSPYSMLDFPRIEGRAGHLIVTDTRRGQQRVSEFLAVLRASAGEAPAQQ